MDKLQLNKSETTSTTTDHEIKDIGTNKINKEKN